MNIILASKSERRHKLLESLGLDFSIVESNFDESSIEITSPEEYCQKVAYSKAMTVASKYSESTIIGADTIVYANKQILGKPSNYNEAFKMIKLLSNKIHSVYTGVSIILKSKSINLNFIELTKVKFFNLDDEEIRKYILKNKPYDKAGSYGIQDREMLFVDYIIGNYENVIGLPISKLYKALLKLNIIK